MPNRKQHSARAFPYDVVVGNLDRLVQQGLVSEKIDGWHSLFCYTQKCTFDREWNPFTRMARGLIVDREKKEVVATPFEKFFNLFERPEETPETWPDGAEILTKEDGSLIVVWYDGREWRTCTKGSFWSDQAVAARDWILQTPAGTRGLVKGCTYCCEWVGPQNRIVVPYEKSDLVLLAVFDPDGFELPYDSVGIIAILMGWRVADRHSFDSLTHLIDHASTLPVTQEGFVVRLPDGLRLKIKGDEYKRVHALISNCTPLAIWASLAAGDDVELIKKELPEEFWDDFDTIVRIIEQRVATLVYATADVTYRTASMSDKEVGLALPSIPEPYRHLVFPFRKHNSFCMSQDSRFRKAVYKLVRPTGNVLEGYTPSYAMHRVAEESL
jgi:putative RNA ligase